MLQTYVLSATVLALAWPLHLLGGQKNPVGQLIGSAILLLVAVPSLRRLLPCLLILVPGLLITQGRGAIIATIVGAAFAFCGAREEWPEIRRISRSSALVHPLLSQRCDGTKAIQGNGPRLREGMLESTDMKKIAVVLAIVTGTAVAAMAGVDLSVAFGTPVVDCPDGDVSVEYTISATSASFADVTEKLTNGGTLVAENSYSIGAGGNSWINGGRIKTFDGQFQKTWLPDGDYSLEVCVTQPGSVGNPGKSDCQTIAIVVACAEQWVNPCASAAPFGEVVGNDRIRPNATAQINFRGNFGALASVEITGPNGFQQFGMIAKAGDSCNYHANWKFTNTSGADFYGNSGQGVYTVKVSGNGNSLEFPVTLQD
jgi:hypothetical protein